MPPPPPALLGVAASAAARGWFLIDLISIIPFKLIADASNSDALGSLSILRIIRLLRLIKLVRVVRASRLWKRFEMTTDMSYASMTMVKYLVVSLVSTHWVRPSATCV